MAHWEMSDVLSKQAGQAGQAAGGEYGQWGASAIFKDQRVICHPLEAMGRRLAVLRRWEEEHQSSRRVLVDRASNLGSKRVSGQRHCTVGQSLSCGSEQSKENKMESDRVCRPGRDVHQPPLLPTNTK